MKVSELPYERVKIEELREKMPQIVARIREAKTVEEILAAREDYHALLKRFYTNAALASMRYTINTVDEFYVAENEYYDEIGPEAQALNQEYAKAMLESPLRSELEEKLGTLVFKQWEIELKSMSPAIIEDMVEENKVVMEYSKLMAGMDFEFHGEKMPRTLLMGYAKSEDRETRRECYEALGKGPKSLMISSTAWCTSATAWQRRWATRTLWSLAITAWAVLPTGRRTWPFSARIF